MLRARENDHDPREVVDLTFDAFDKGGAGALASWMILSGNQDVLDPILEAIQKLVDMIAEDHDHDGLSAPGGNAAAGADRAGRCAARWPDGQGAEPAARNGPRSGDQGDDAGAHASEGLTPFPRLKRRGADACPVTVRR
jgi:hypothetical protein